MLKNSLYFQLSIGMYSKKVGSYFEHVETFPGCGDGLGSMTSTIMVYFFLNVP